MGLKACTSSQQQRWAQHKVEITFQIQAEIYVHLFDGLLPFKKVSIFKIIRCLKHQAIF